MPRLLVIDDDPHVRGLVPKLAYRLVGSSVQVVSAADLGEAMAIQKASPADLALIDCFMPGLDGPEVLRRLQQSWPRLRAILMTGDNSMAGREIAGALVPVRDKASLDAIVEEAVQAALEAL